MNVHNIGFFFVEQYEQVTLIAHLSVAMSVYAITFLPHNM